MLHKLYLSDAIATTTYFFFVLLLYILYYYSTAFLAYEHTVIWIVKQSCGIFSGKTRPFSYKLLEPVCCTKQQKKVTN